MLDEVHQVIQEAFGWTDSHLHQFGSGPHLYGPETECYLCPFQVDEGETGIPEEQVRLDEVLAEAGDKLYYSYDFGDDWQHVIKLESVRARETDTAGPDPAPRAVCTDGRRDGPAEDCGGVYAHELITAATDPMHPGHADAVAEFHRVFGGEVDPGAVRTVRFDIDTINAELAAAFPATPSRGAGYCGAASAGGLSGSLGELVSAVRDSAGRRELRRLLDAACLDEPVLVDAGTAAGMVRLSGEPAVVVLVHRTAPLLEPPGQPVWLSQPRWSDVANIDGLHPVVTGVGGQVDPSETAREFRGSRLLDCPDPEGNVVQLRQPLPAV